VGRHKWNRPNRWPRKRAHSLHRVLLTPNRAQAEEYHEPLISAMHTALHDSQVVANERLQRGEHEEDGAREPIRPAERATT
jgi:hypothetical protein